MHNVSVVLNKIFGTERLNILEDKKNALLLNLLITLLNFWIGDIIYVDNFLLSSCVDLLEILIKSSLFCSKFKSAFIISSMMNASKLDFIST